MTERLDPPVDIDRRAFLRSMTGMGIGVVTGVYVLPPVAFAATLAATEVTHEHVGNANVQEMVQSECEAKPDPKACEEAWVPDDNFMVYSTVVAPIREEFAFRAVPSTMLDVVSRRSHAEGEGPMDVLAHGTSQRTFSRGEVIAGALSSLAFAAVHNATAKGYDTKAVPLPQAMTGMTLWGLARKFGIGSSIAAHAGLNSFLFTLTRMRPGR